MGSVGSKNLTYNEILTAIVGEDSYANTDEYKTTQKNTSDLFTKMKDLEDKEEALRDELKKESTRKPREEWTTEDEIDALLGERPASYTERGEEIRTEMEKLDKQINELREKWETSANKLRKLDNAQVDIQKDLYSTRPDSERTVSTDVKDSYKGFKVGESTTSYVDDALKSGNAFVVEMSPKEYLQECAYNIFNNSTLERTVRGTSANSVTRYMNMMKKGIKFDTPYLNYRDKEQEGRHRAIAAYLLGYKKIPVIVMLPNGRKL